MYQWYSFNKNYNNEINKCLLTSGKKKLETCLSHILELCNFIQNLKCRFLLNNLKYIEKSMY